MKSWIMDYLITWKYIVEQMEIKFGIKSDNMELFSMHEIEVYIEKIWNNFFNEKYNEEFNGIPH